MRWCKLFQAARTVRNTMVVDFTQGYRRLENPPTDWAKLR
ncbi:hypothetical protein I553_5653 [Mycobacterium xenopi 4042]|uniref:Uncharacterized protein n=1 Tax=Mycobacterium xenopi 4042 TaxID=1299334 RepID=X7ZWN6_MYCXE|nr:hypothetical protein I553_5653 [Mycobacterium xenopi 4042]EUA52058.1 hypothetical protein I552_3005 [Mycobacterium xenopi 3993]